MADLINLNRFRKDKARAAREAKAGANRILFGRSKAEKQEAKRAAEAADRHLDGHLRDGDPDGSKR